MCIKEPIGMANANDCMNCREEGFYTYEEMNSLAPIMQTTLSNAYLWWPLIYFD